MSTSKYDGATINSLEKRIENGIQFEVSNLLSVANAGGVGKWLFRTGNKKIVIDLRRITSNGDELTYQAFANPTVSADGTAVTPISNRDGNSATLSEVTMFHTPTTTDNGNPIPAVYMPGAAGQGQRTVGQFAQDGLVRILQSNTDYLVTITNNGSENPANIELYLLWSEVNDPSKV
tara:strand:- start:3189 stop:3719 length:531 start_codon:yes stop_codon:yes gene_type:complete